MSRVLAIAMVFACVPAVHAQEFKEFSSKGLPGSQGVDVRVRHPAGWKKVDVEDDIGLAELRGPQGKVTGILQIARGLRRPGTELACDPQRASTMLQHLEADESDTRVTDVAARTTEGRPGYEIRYERSNAPGFMLVRSRVVCLKDSKVLVSCGATADARAALAEIEPVCGEVLDSLHVTED